MTGDAPRHVPYRLGGDLVIQDDVSRFGLHRRHVIQYGRMPDVDALLMSVPRHAVSVHHLAWMNDDPASKDAGTGHVYIVWKEGEHGQV